MSDILLINRKQTFSCETGTCILEISHNVFRKDRFTFFNSVLKQYLNTHIYVETVVGGCNHQMSIFSLPCQEGYFFLSWRVGLSVCQQKVGEGCSMDRGISHSILEQSHGADKHNYFKLFTHQ